MSLRTGDRGLAVEQLQHELEAAGFDPGGIDGIFGPRTAAAVRALQQSAGLHQDAIVGPDTIAALAALLQDREGAPDVDGEDVPDDEESHDEDQWPDDAEDAQQPSVPTSFPDYFDNWAGELAAGYREPFYLHEASGRRLEWRGRPASVDVTTRTHICMHITAVEFGTSARQRTRWADRIAQGSISEEVLYRYGGRTDAEGAAERMALHERFWSVAYHWIALRNGDVLYNNPPERYIYHGNRSNRFALGVSIEANLPGREQDRRSDHTHVTDHLVETGRAALRLAVNASRDQGAPLTHITAHRAFSMTRAGDPGEAVWKQIVLPMLSELDLAVDYHLVDGGRHIPEVWDPAALYDWRNQPLR